MEFESNAKYGQKPEEGSIFELKNNNLKMSIHHYVGCGDSWFLSYKALGISCKNLYTNDFTEAVIKAKEVIWEDISGLIEEFNKIKTDSIVSISRN